MKLPPLGRYQIALLFLVSGLVYAYCVIALGQTSGVYFDSEQYLKYGINLFTHGVYGTSPGVPDMNREAGYGIFLCGLIAITKTLGLTPNLATLGEPANVFWLKAAQALFLYGCSALLAFRTNLREKVRWPLFLLLILSPSCIGVVREIYSEALAVPLSILLIFFVARSLQVKGFSWNIVGGAVAFAMLLLTKSYLQYASYLFFGIAVWRLARRTKQESIWLWVALAVSGIAAQSAWNFRNASVLGDKQDEARLTIALAGKIARIHEVHWAKDFPVALAGSVGTNFCDRIFDSARCTLFDYRGCDTYGLNLLVAYREKFSPSQLADKNLRNDMKALFFKRPISQLLGSGLELFRMFFFESVLDAGTLPSLIQWPARAWHVIGSLGFWVLIFISLAGFKREWTKLPNHTRTLSLFCLALLAYHAITMSQITNVVRYTFPILPYLYFFAAHGIAELAGKKGA